MFRGAKAKGGFRERILASRKMNVMQKMKQAAAAFSKGSSSFSHLGFALLKLNPYFEIIEPLRKTLAIDATRLKLFAHSQV